MVRNHYNYFTEVEQRFQQRRGSLLLLSPLDWALIQTWREGGVPLEAVLRGIDATFDKREARKSARSSRRVNGLAWCAQAVMQQAEAIQEALVGAAHDARSKREAQPGFEAEQIAAHLNTCAEQLRAAALLREPVALQAGEMAARLQGLASEACVDLEQLELTLSTMEQRLLSMLLATAPEQELLELREQAARQLAPYRSRMQSLQIRQIEQQFLHKHLLERYQLPRLSLFYMSQG